MELKIDSLNHEQYTKLIEYLNKDIFPSQDVTKIGPISLYEIKSIENIQGINPVRYENIILKIKTYDEMKKSSGYIENTEKTIKEDKKRVKESIKGLIDLLF